MQILLAHTFDFDKHGWDFWQNTKDFPYRTDVFTTETTGHEVLFIGFLR